MNTQTRLDPLLLSSGHKKETSCLFNLIVYTQEPRRTRYFQSLVKMIMKQFSCRVIFIQADPTSEKNSSEIQISQESSHDELGIVCDQIYIKVAGDAINRVYFLLLPLFVPDLPIYLIWGQDPTTEDKILPYLVNFASRLIVDSEVTEDLQVFSKNMQNLMCSSPILTLDMNWTRIGGWREVFAQIFDSKERFEQLASAESIHLIYNSRPNDFSAHLSIQAVYLQAWLTSRLKWQYQKEEEHDQIQVMYYQSEKSTCQIHLIPQINQNFEPEEILEIHVKGPDSECNIVRISHNQVQIHASNQYECVLPFVLLLPILRFGRRFVQEIFYQKISDQYAPTLEAISELK